MNKSKITILFIISILISSFIEVKALSDNDSISWQELDDIVIEKKSGIRSIGGPENAFKINQSELMRAACCNLGESFTTNPSVDVNYSDAATGAKQIKLLGLSGNYVQMMTENLPNFRGASRPYSLRYVPGPWMKSISVSKGCSTVKNGYEAITGQINVEYLKPQDPEGVSLNLYLDSDLKLEANADANFHLPHSFNSVILAHFEDRYRNHDSNHDGFTDMPDITQVNLQNRWNHFSDKYIFHGGAAFIYEKSKAGQLSEHTDMTMTPYLINMDTKRVEAYMKHAFFLDGSQNSNIALMANGSFHDFSSLYGYKGYDVKEWNGFAQLMFETSINETHNISTGLSYNYDYFNQYLILKEISNIQNLKERESTAGAYFQYTWKPIDKFTLMAGLRGDYSSLYKWFVTPRLNLSYNPFERFNIKASAGKGYRTVFAWAEYNYLLASSRNLVVENLNQEASWNYGFNLDYTFFLGANNIKLGLEYYYTKFDRQVIVDYETPHQLTIGNLNGRSFSHTFQIEAFVETTIGLNATLAWRLNDVKTTYEGSLLTKPLTSKYKGLVSIGYSTPMDIWQFDLTLQINGKGRMPAPYILPDGTYSWNETFPTYPMLNFQVTRWFRHFSIYIGGENLTNYKQKNPIISSSDPWGADFDTTLVWGPITGAMIYAGIRFDFGKI